MNEEYINPDTGNSFAYDAYVALRRLHESGQEVFLAEWTGIDKPGELVPAFGRPLK